MGNTAGSPLDYLPVRGGGNAQVGQPTILGSLPADHRLRNLPLREINAQIRNRTGKMWREVATWKIGLATYNELGGPWTELNEFGVWENR